MDCAIVREVALRRLTFRLQVLKITLLWPQPVEHLNTGLATSLISSVKTKAECMSLKLISHVNALEQDLYLYCNTIPTI